MADLVGAVKIKDGLFLGDELAAQDLEFILANKITHIINCAGREIANSWERSGVRYLTYYWPESGNCIVFDEANAVLDEIYGFIEEAIDLGESVLVHSTVRRGRGGGRSARGAARHPPPPVLRAGWRVARELLRRRVLYAQVPVVAAEDARVPAVEAPRLGAQAGLQQAARCARHVAAGARGRLLLFRAGRHCVGRAPHR